MSSAPGKAPPSHRLYLLRHAKATQDENPGPDIDRPLTSRGEKDARALRDYMHRKDMAPAIVLVSVSRRTVQTLDHLMPLAASAKVSRMDQLYLASAETIRDIVRDLDEDQHSALVIGHNPGMQELALALLAGDEAARGRKKARRIAEAFPTCALAVFDLPGPWREAGTTPARLKRFVIPRDLR